MPDLPISQATDNATFKVLVEGQPLPGEIKVLRMDIRHEVNSISNATLLIDDGDAAGQSFGASSADELAPGKTIELQLGYGADDETVFTGVITGQHVSIKRRGQSLLRVDCRDASYAMTLVPQSRYYREVTDSELFEELIDGYGLTPEVTATAETHDTVVQYQVSDWDFMVSRAERLGMLCICDGGTVRVSPLPVAAAPVLSVAFGQNVYDADLELDARHQTGQVSAYSWDMSGQSVLQARVNDVSVNSPGNLDGPGLATAAGANDLALRHGGHVSQGQLDAWAEAAMTWRRLAKVKGTVRIQGTSDIALAGMVDLGGFGDRFSGGGLVSGVHHSLSETDWLTTLQIGTSPAGHHQRFPINPLPADGFARPAPGLYSGTVTQLEGDPDGEQRIRDRIPLIDDSAEGVWARLASPDAGDNRGMVFRPELGDEVVVASLSDDPDHPVILGMLHSSAKPAPLEASDENNEKGYVSRSGIRMVFDDDDVSVTLETPNGNKVVLSEADGTLSLVDENDNRIKLSQDGIELDSPGDIKVGAQGDVSIEGINVAIKASAGLSLEGSSEASLTSAGSTTVKGSLVQIN